MRKILTKILIKVIGENPFEMTVVDTKEMQDWLFESFQSKGQKSYYTLRKKFIQNELGVGMEQQEYWKRLGRLEELQALNDNISKEVSRRDKINKQHKE